MMVGSNPAKGIQVFQVFLTEPHQNGGKFESVHFMLRVIYIQKAYFESSLALVMSTVKEGQFF